MAKYDDSRYAVKHTMNLPDVGATQTSVIAANTVIRRVTMQHAVTITGFNAVFKIGGTQTATAAAAKNFVAIAKSLAGTGALSQIGQIAIGTQANDTVKDGTVSTPVSLAAGDDLVAYYPAGTGLAAGIFQAGVQVQYLETFTG